MQTNKKRKRIYWVIGGIVLLAAVAVLLAYNQLNQDQAAAAEPQVGDTVTAFIGDLSASATASGQVLPGREVSLSLADGPPGRVEQVYVRVGDTVQAGDVLLQLDTADLLLNVAAAGQNLLLKQASLAGLLETPGDAEIAAAQAAVASAQASLDDLLAGSSVEELAASEANLRAAEASLRAASAELTGVYGSISDAQIQAAEAALMAAQLNQQNAQETNQENPNQATHDVLMEADRAVAAAQGRLDTLQAGPDQGQLGAAQGSVASASARMDGRQANLNLLAGGAAPAQIAAAESQLAQAEATLANLLDGPLEAQIRAAEAEVEQSSLSLADAQDALDQATLTTPFDGVVTAVYVSKGEFASGIAIELVDTDSLEVVLQVDEVDIGELAVGQPAVITLEAWPDKEIESQILSIAPSAASSALVTFDVHLALGQTEQPVLVGMTADANLITAQKEGVLLVPNHAIHADRQAGTYSVNVMLNETVRQVQVTVGLHDKRYTQITGGLNAGDELLVGNSIPTEDVGPGHGGMFGGRDEN